MKPTAEVKERVEALARGVQSLKRRVAWHKGHLEEIAHLEATAPAREERIRKAREALEAAEAEERGAQYSLKRLHRLVGQEDRR